MSKRPTPETDAIYEPKPTGTLEYIGEKLCRRLERQRDELLEACIECDEAFGKFWPDPDSRCGMAWAKAEAAIASVKGEKL